MFTLEAQVHVRFSLGTNVSLFSEYSHQNSRTVLMPPDLALGHYMVLEDLEFPVWTQPFQYYKYIGFEAGLRRNTEKGKRKIGEEWTWKTLLQLFSTSSQFVWKCLYLASFNSGITNTIIKLKSTTKISFNCRKRNTHKPKMAYGRTRGHGCYSL